MFHKIQLEFRVDLWVITVKSFKNISHYSVPVSCRLWVISIKSFKLFHKIQFQLNYIGLEATKH
jgi:hypothetical protein